MNAHPALSVVVPTCGRPASMRRLLASLAQQEHAPPFEVVVVADGVSLDAIGIHPEAAWPFALRVVHQPPLGPAVARNRGADEASAPLLLFMDDDVEPSAASVRAHADFHARRVGAIGAGDLTPAPLAGGFTGAALAGWWERMCDGLHDRRHRFTFRDLLTGHCSMSRELFEHVGRFDASFRCHEDFEFGFRAIEAGASFGYVTGAEALHHDATQLTGILGRKFAEGRADVQMVAKHPRILRALPLGRTLAVGRLARRVYDAALRHDAGGDLLNRSLLVAMRTFERLSMRDKWREALERAMDFAYWRGVLAEAGSPAAVVALRARVDPPLADPILVDLRRGFAEAEDRIDRLRPLALRVMIGSHEVCVLPEEPGSERIRGAHLRPLILKGYPGAFAAAARRAGTLPEVLARLVPETASSPDTQERGSARVA